MMRNNKIINIVFWGLFLTLMFPANSAQAGAPIPPDRAQTILNDMSLECQRLNDYAYQASQGNYSNFNTTKDQISIVANNISLYLGGFDTNSTNQFLDLYNNFQEDASSAQNAAASCQSIRDNAYRNMASNDGILNPPQNISSFDECQAAGYFVSAGSCFIGGNTVYDSKGNIIGVYNVDCFDASGYHQGQCWYCEYGSDENGCLIRP